jgi:hypothetical protein
LLAGCVFPVGPWTSSAAGRREEGQTGQQEERAGPLGALRRSSRRTPSREAVSGSARERVAATATGIRLNPRPNRK